MYETETSNIAKILNLKNPKNISSVEIIKFGRNSKVFKFLLNNKMFIAKFYETESKINRLDRELFFYDYLLTTDIDSTAKIIKFSKTKNCTIFSYINGKKIEHIQDKNILQCVKFVTELNKNLEVNKDDFNFAIDGVKTRIDHIKLCEDRINIMKSIENKSPIGKDFHIFFKDSIMKKWNILKKNFYENYMCDEFNNLIKNDELIISPSDFGFHNILLKNEKLFFFDFEYSGLDDPIKLVCDFISQPDQNINFNQINIFKNKLFCFLKNKKYYSELTEIFLPFHQLKWCCIVLNEFRSDKILIRDHAGLNTNNILQMQLSKAKNLYYNFFGN